MVDKHVNKKTKFGMQDWNMSRTSGTVTLGDRSGSRANDGEESNGEGRDEHVGNYFGCGGGKEGWEKMGKVKND